jgi:hypothetical protein
VYTVFVGWEKENAMSFKMPRPEEMLPAFMIDEMNRREKEEARRIHEENERRPRLYIEEMPPKKPN